MPSPEELTETPAQGVSPFDPSQYEWFRPARPPKHLDLDSVAALYPTAFAYWRPTHWCYSCMRPQFPYCAGERHTMSSGRRSPAYWAGKALDPEWLARAEMVLKVWKSPDTGFVGASLEGSLNDKEHSPPEDSNKENVRERAKTFEPIRVVEEDPNNAQK